MGLPETREDRFLDGRVVARQPRQGFRSGLDAVLLAAAVPAVSGQAALELGCGAGVASLCLAARVSGIRLVGVEVQPAYAEIARLNARHAGCDMTIVTADLRDLPAELRQQSFDHVFANPPYFLSGARAAAAAPDREQALGEMMPLFHWVRAAARRLRPGGVFTCVQRAERLPDLLGHVAEHPFGACEVLPLLPREGRPAGLVLLRAIRDRRTPFVLRPPVVLHTGITHAGDREDYTPAVSNVVRNAAPMPGFSQGPFA